MKPTSTSMLYHFWCCMFLICSLTTAAQSVGINTTEPEGILDIKSATQGFVLPRVALSRTNSSSPVINPKDGTGVIPVGTMVYNTFTSSLGANDVSEGIYAWDGNKWDLEFTRNQSEFYEQTSLGILTASNAGFHNITGLIGLGFTASYTGKYRVKVDVNYGGNSAINPGSSDGNLNVARASGIFRFTFGGIDYDIPAHSYSTAYDSSIGATNYFAIWQEYSIILYLDLTAESVTNFSLTFDQDPMPDYRWDGNLGAGRGLVGYDIPCSVEITYVGD